MSRIPQASIAGVLRGFAELLLTVGALLAALAFYLLVWTNLQTAAAQKDLLQEFRSQQQTDQTGQAGRQTRPGTGDGLNVLHIPRLGKDWKRVVVEGVDMKSLNTAPGHFPDTALPGQVGNYAVAGHRATHGEPFADLDRMVAGDKVYVEAANGWFTYQVTWSRIIAPNHTEILAPVAGKPGQAPTARTLTLITCHPRWGSTERLVVGAQLVEERSLAAGPPEGMDS
ncbi:class E sortase [Aeromicrobium wangtongii]|uniref:Class E sortase n=1 Tax=Aeromicrobium wangtongii TaxID=2969247 RepID=A0ABY5M6E9_9ACTN|nr:class E sortase [Aeromicrobium wangtongii]MCD9198613.1 class E sortase [Aeromicrobium wangtongii]UUP12639.1 class E sortase [Aeromicrobium wangtongii]